MNRLLSLGFLFVAAIVSISIATKYSRGVAFRSQAFLRTKQATPPKHLRRFTEFNLLRGSAKYSTVAQQGGCSMKKIALLTAALLALSSVAASAQSYGGPYYGKGKAPPPPVVTKG